MAQIFHDDYFSPHPLIIPIPVTEENEESNEPICKRTRSKTNNKSSSNNSNSSSNTLQKNLKGKSKQDLSFMDFKFNNCMLGEG